jgi:hypothetical protein
MQAFSAADLISPAIKRTKWFLFEPFRWSTFLKLCLVAVLTEGGSSGNFNFNVPGGHHSGTPSSTTHSTISIGAPYFGLSPMLIVLIAAMIVVTIGLALVIAYLVTRLRFSLFHCLVSGTREIRPGWRLYDAQSWRFFLLSIVIGFIFFLAALLIVIPFLLGFYRLIRSAQPGDPSNFAAIFGLILPLIPIIILFVLVGIAIHVILHDLMLPHVALENASAAEAWRQARMRIAAEKGGFLLYAFLRIILPIAATIGAMIALAIPAVIAVILFAAPMAGLIGLMTGASFVGKVLLVLLLSVIVLVGAGLVILLGLCVGGPIGIAVRNYALLFYGGRYQVLGDQLSPPPPPPLIESPSAAI